MNQSYKDNVPRLGFRRAKKAETEYKNKMNTKDKTINEAHSEPLQQCSVSRSYFHEISQEEVDKLISDKRNVGYIMENYKQPDWCNYPEALSMTMGCWSLCDLKKDGLRTKISKDFCKGCDEYSL